MKTVIITGAAGGLGKTVVQTFLEHSYRVVAFVRKEADAKELSAHAGLSSIVADLGNEEAAAAAVQEVIAKAPIDAVLLLAGGYASGDIRTTGSADIRKQIALNFETAYHVVRPAFNHMMENKSGRIVLIGSQPPLMPKKARTSLAYSLSKSLLFHLAEVLNEEAKGTDVVTAVVVPSTIDTPANRQAMPKADASAWVSPAELAAILEFLCSDTSGPLREPVMKVYKNA